MSSVAWLSRRPLLLVVAALLLQGTLVLLGGRISGISATSAGSYARADSGSYLTIATGGYSIAYCGPDKTTIPMTGPPRAGGMGVYCGNTGWFPGWSVFVAGLHKLGINEYLGGVLTSWAFRILGLWAIALWLVRQKLDDSTVLATMVAAAAFPGSIYYIASFPLAVTVLSIMVLLEAARRNSFWLAGLGAFYAAFSYSNGWVGPAAIGGCLTLFAMSQRRWQPFWLATAVVASAFMGVVAVFAIMQVQTGYWQAYFLLQSIYEHHFSFLNALEHVRTSARHVLAAPFALTSAMDWQTLVVVVWLTMTAAIALARRKTVDPIVLLSLSAAAASFVFPKLMGAEADISQVRYESMLLPLLCGFPLLPRKAQWLFALAFVLLTPLTAALFFLTAII